MVIVYLKVDFELICTVSILLYFILLVCYLLIRNCVKKFLYNKKITTMKQKHNFITKSHIFYKYIDYHNIYFDKMNNIIFSSMYFPIMIIQKKNKSII